MAKMDTIESLPKIFKDNNLFLIPLSAKEYVIVKGNGYHKLEPIDKNSIIHYTDKPFPISAANSKGEAAYLDYSYSSGLLERVIGTAKLDRGFHGKRRTTTFKFHINSLPITVSHAQIEVDESYETKKEIIIFEAKKGIPSSFSIRQLYYPYRTFINIKSTRLFLFSFDKKEKEYLFWEYEFDPYDSFESITLVNASKFKIKLKVKKISVKPYLNVAPVRSKIDIPQADDINKILLFPLKVSEGYNTSAKIEGLFGFVRRQSNYYRQACEILGLIQSYGGIFHLTKKGEEYLKLSADEKSRFIGQLLLEFPIMNEIFLKAIMEPNKVISIHNIIQIIKKRSYLQGTTLGRRARTIVCWFKWIRNNLGLIEVDRAGSISSFNSTRGLSQEG